MTASEDTSAITVKDLGSGEDRVGYLVRIRHRTNCYDPPNTL